MFTSFYLDKTRDEADLLHMANPVLVLCTMVSFKSFCIMKAEYRLIDIANKKFVILHQLHMVIIFNFLGVFFFFMA